MKIKVSEASGVVLDYLVAKCEGVPSPDFRPHTYKRNTAGNIYLHKLANFPFEPSVDWSQGGPIIERERITFDYLDYSSGPEDVVRASLCRARLKPDRSASWYASKGGSTLLKAAMRCYVASKLGEEVEVPDDLANSTGTC